MAVLDKAESYRKDAVATSHIGFAEDTGVAWMHSGKSFCIYDKKKFASTVLPNYFQGIRFSSFTRQMRRWGFKAIQGLARNSAMYSHPMFIRGDLFNCNRMRPLGHQKKSRQRSPAATVQSLQKEDMLNTKFCPSSRRAEKGKVNISISSAQKNSEAPAMTAAASAAAFNLLSFSKAAAAATSGEKFLPSPHYQHHSSTTSPRMLRGLDSPVLVETGTQQSLRAANQPALEERAQQCCSTEKPCSSLLQAQIDNLQERNSALTMHIHQQQQLQDQQQWLKSSNNYYSNDEKRTQLGDLRDHTTHALLPACSLVACSPVPPDLAAMKQHQNMMCRNGFTAKVVMPHTGARPFAPITDSCFNSNIRAQQEREPYTHQYEGPSPIYHQFQHTSSPVDVLGGALLVQKHHQPSSLPLAPAVDFLKFRMERSHHNNNGLFPFVSTISGGAYASHTASV